MPTFDLYHNFDTHMEILWYHYWCWLLMSCNHLYTGATLSPTVWMHTAQIFKTNYKKNPKYNQTDRNNATQVDAHPQVHFISQLRIKCSYNILKYIFDLKRTSKAQVVNWLQCKWEEHMRIQKVVHDSSVWCRITCMTFGVNTLRG